MHVHPPAMLHGELEEAFPDVFFVTGTSRPKIGDDVWQYSRNMVVVREGEQLTLINSVRLDEPGLVRLEALGRVSHVVKLGAFHGMDDRFYCERYAAKQWAPHGMLHEDGHVADEVLLGGGLGPFAGLQLFSFATSKHPESAIVIDRTGGILVSCDSLQNWVEVDSYFDSASALRMSAMGFIKPANIGPGWRMAAAPEASDFARLKALSFRHLLPGHGRPIRDTAHAQLSATFEREFGA
ncbi:MAG TPA: hypothetical protein VIK01_02815 [Polyangiaceae bacterium]